MMASVTDLSAFKHKRDNPYDSAVNLEQELYAHTDGKVWPIRSWGGIDGEPCSKDDAVSAIAGGDDPNKGPWFLIWLAAYGLGPHQDKIMKMLAKKQEEDTGGISEASVKTL